MQDNDIIELYFSRSESAISETDKSYGKYCRFIAFNILRSDEDAEECVNDTYLRTWNSIPPQRPGRLQTFLGKITRNLALNKYEKSKAQKRGGGETALLLDELSECVGNTYTETADAIVLKDIINTFLSSIDTRSRKLFVRRYWYASTVAEIAKDYNMTEANVSVMLFRARKKLREILEREGFAV